jgi:hypothetical protein
VSRAPAPKAGGLAGHVKEPLNVSYLLNALVRLSTTKALKSSPIGLAYISAKEEASEWEAVQLR